MDLRPVRLHEQRIELVIKKAHSVGGDGELQAHLARYICVLVSGYMEASIQHLLSQHAVPRSSQTVQSFVSTSLESFQNARPQKIAELLGRFDTGWLREIDAFLGDRRGAAVNNVVLTRHAIAHGENTGITLKTVTEHYQACKEVVDFLANLVD